MIPAAPPSRPLTGGSGSDRSWWLRQQARLGTATSSERSNSVARHNNSWYRTEFAYEPVDRVRAAMIVVPPSAGSATGHSDAHRRKVVEGVDDYSATRSPAKRNGERYSYMEGCLDGIRRDMPALRFYTLDVPEATKRLPASKSTTSPWILPPVTPRGDQRRGPVEVQVSRLTADAKPRGCGTALSEVRLQTRLF